MDNKKKIEKPTIKPAKVETRALKTEDLDRVAGGYRFSGSQ